MHFWLIKKKMGWGGLTSHYPAPISSGYGSNVLGGLFKRGGTVLGKYYIHHLYIVYNDVSLFITY